MNSSSDLWNPTQTGTLGELVVAAAALLDRIDPTVTDGRVASAVDARTVRYHQGLGLVDKPLRYDGRRAIYGRRHLVQVLAVKLLQSQGYGLARIQEAFGAQPYEAIEGGVLQALGQPATAAPPALVQRPTFEIAPGVQVTIDPALVADPQALAQRLHDFIHQGPPLPGARP